MLTALRAGGGASTGIELATGHPVAIAINHDQSAIMMQPRESEYCEMMQDVDALKRREKRRKIKTAAAIIIGFVSAAICCLGLI